MNPRKIFPFVWVSVVFLVQNALNFAFPQRTPALLLCAVLFYAFSEGPVFGMLLGAYAGLLLEIFGTGRFGYEILVFAATGFLFGRGTKTFFRESFFLSFLVPVLAFYFMTVLRLLIFHLSSGEGFPSADELWFPWETLTVFAVCPVVFFFLKKVGHGVS